MQSHQIDIIKYEPTEGFEISLKAITDEGFYSCHDANDINGFSEHVQVTVHCELKKCHLRKLSTGVASNTVFNQITSKRTSHLTTIATTASNAKIKQIRSGDGPAFLTKRHISSNSYVASMQTPPFDLQPNQPSTLSNLEVETATQSITTVNSRADDIDRRRFSNRRQMPTRPYQLDKSKRRG